MSIANEEFQSKMKVLGASLFTDAGRLVAEQGVVKPDAQASPIGQLVMQSLLGHCEAARLNGSYLVYGVGYAIGSLLAQVPCAASSIRTALDQGVEDGQADARRSFGSGGRA